MISSSPVILAPLPCSIFHLSPSNPLAIFFIPFVHYLCPISEKQVPRAGIFWPASLVTASPLPTQSLAQGRSSVQCANGLFGQEGIPDTLKSSQVIHEKRVIQNGLSKGGKFKTEMGQVLTSLSKAFIPRAAGAIGRL